MIDGDFYCVDYEDLKELKEGDQVRIVDSWEPSGLCGESEMCDMDCWLGQVMTIEHIIRYGGDIDGFRMVEDENRWYWNSYCIAQIIPKPKFDCITEDEFYAIKVGDTVRIVDFWEPDGRSDQEPFGMMDRYLGTKATVAGRWNPENLQIVEDNHDWYWNRYCIAEVNPQDEPEFAFRSDEEFLAAYSQLF